MLYWI